MTATALVLEWSRAEVAAGPSVAEESHGWRPVWVDFPFVSNTSPVRVRFSDLG